MFLSAYFAQRKVACAQVVVELVRRKSSGESQRLSGVRTSRHGDVKAWKDPDFSDVMRKISAQSRRTLGLTCMASPSTMSFQPFAKSQREGAKVHPRSWREWASVSARRVPGLHYVGAISCKNQKTLCVRIGTRHRKSRPPRKGRALLQGIVYCGRCDAWMSVLYYSTKETRSASYGCSHDYHRHGECDLPVHECQGRRSDTDPVVSQPR